MSFISLDLDIKHIKTINENQISSDGLHMMSRKEWAPSEEIHNPLLSFNMQDLIVYGSNKIILVNKI